MRETIDANRQGMNFRSCLEPSSFFSKEPQVFRGHTQASMGSPIWHIQNYNAVAFWDKLRVATVAKISISEGLPDEKFPLLSKNHVASLMVCLP